MPEQPIETLSELEKTAIRNGIGVGLPETPASILTHLQAFDAGQETAARVAMSAVGTPAEITNSLKGAVADVTRIGTEYMPEAQTISSLGFADGSAAVLADGKFSGGAPGDPLIYRHNNTDAGGIPYAPLPRNTILKTSVFSTARLANRVANDNTAGTVLTSGNMEVVITAALVTGSPLTVTVPVLVGDRAQEWNVKVVDALNANAAVNPHYTFYAMSGFIQMQEVVQSVSDVFSIRTWNGVGSVTGIADNTSSQSLQFAYLSLGEFNLKGSEMVDGTKFYISGSVNANLGTVTTAVNSYYLSFYTGAEIAFVSRTVGVSSANLLPDSTGKLYFEARLGCPALMKLASGTVSLSLLNTDTLPGGNQGTYYQREQSTGAVTVRDLVYAQNAGKGTPNLPNKITLALVVQIAPTNTSGFATTHLTLHKVSAW